MQNINPGSWYASQTKSEFGSWAVFTRSGSYNIGDATAPDGPEGAKQNTTLAAAAPDLLAKLKEAHAELMGVACQPSDRLCHTQRARLSRLAREFGEVLRAAQPDQA